MKVHIGKSKLHGKGLLALQDIKKGGIVFTIKGKKIKFLINDRKKAKIAGFNWIGISKNSWIDPSGFGLFANHSCDPNSAIKGKVQVVAIKDIKKGEEVTSDYSLTEADIFWHIKCSCGSKNCRKTINSIQFLPEKTFKSHINHIPNYFKRIFNKFRVSKFKTPGDLENVWVDFIKK